VLPLPTGVESLTVTYRVQLSPEITHCVYSQTKNGLIHPLYLDVTANKEKVDNGAYVAPDEWQTIAVHIETSKYVVELNGKRIAAGKVKRSLLESPIQLHFTFGDTRDGGRFVLERPTLTDIKVSK
jgi:hypothetical protein